MKYKFKTKLTIQECINKLYELSDQKIINLNGSSPESVGEYD